MAGQSVRAAAEKAARAALRQEAQKRAATVGAAAETQAHIASLVDQLGDAMARHDAAVATAMQAGWTRDQLRELGVQDDPAGPLRKAIKRPARTGAAAPSSDGGGSAAAAGSAPGAAASPVRP